MPLIPRPKYRAKDWRLAMRTRERNEARRVACEQYTRANKLEEKNIELWATKMKLEQERYTANHRLDECAESLRNVYGLLADAERERDDAIAYGRSIVKELAMVEQRRDDVISQRDNLQQQRDYYQGSKDELVAALKEIYNLHGHRYIDARIIARAALTKADEL